MWHVTWHTSLGHKMAHIVTMCHTKVICQTFLNFTPSQYVIVGIMSQQQQQLPKYINFTFGGLSGMGATFVVQPLDLLKNRLQMTGEGGQKKIYKNSFDAFMKIARSEGVIGMWNGISAGLLRQATYTTTRLGIFSTLQDRYVARERKNPNLLIKVVVCLFVCLSINNNKSS